MNLIIDNHIIDTDLEIILNEIRKLTNNRYLSVVRRSGENYAITCPFHKDGQEHKPSCFVYAVNDNDNVPFGYFKCFTCHEQGQLYILVSKCLNCTIEFAKQWLVDNFSNTFRETSLELTDIDLSNKTNNYLDESVLYNYSYFHPYMFKRGLTEDVIRKFKIGWNPETDAITFPMWDEHNNLVGISERSVNSKYFYIPTGIDLPVYLLNFIIKEHIDEVYVVESQIDALYLWTFGYPAIALIGTGGKKAYSKLKTSGIRKYHLCLDGDLAGKHGILRFIKNMPDDVLIDIIQLPEGKDVNDLTKIEFDSLCHFDKFNFK